MAAALFAAVLQAAPGAGALAQTRSATANQAAIYQSLTPEQQRAVLEQMQRGSSTRTRSPQLEFPATSTLKVPRTTVDADLGYELVKKDPTIKPGDTVVIELSVRPKGDEDKDTGTDARTAAAQGTGSAAAQKQEATPEERVKQREEVKKQKWSPEETRALEQLRDRIRDGNPYKLDGEGVLRLPTIRDIPLAGLTEWQANKRLQTDPALRNYRLRITLLPVERTGEAALKPFGYDLFTMGPTTFAPVSDVPVPSEYVLGPGDTMEVQLLGNSQGEYTLTVGRDGTVQFPDLGPIAVAGLRFPEARKAIEDRVRDQMIGTRVVVSIGELKSITVFITGETEQPGAYSVSGLSTITNALFASGGVKEIGSLRNIQLKRRGRLVATLDLYDLLLKGDTSDDLRLLSGDVIFIPPVGPTAAITGEVRRPAIYEFRGEARASDMLYLAGGLLPNADPRTATIERVGGSGDRLVVSVDLSSPAGRGTPLRSGDLMRVSPVRPQLGNAVTLSGSVYRPGPVAWRQGMKLTDLLSRPEELKPGADLHYVLIRRESADQKVSALSADLEQAWQQPASDANVALAPRDRVYVFSLQGGRELALKPILEELRQQSVSGAPTQTVSVGGRINAPGRYPLETGMRVSDLVRAGAGLGEAAYGTQAELTRYAIVDGEYRQTELLEIDLAGALAGNPSADLALQPFDFLVVKELPQWSEQETVKLEGQVKFPGTYPIKRGETLSSVLKRAGGLTEYSFAEGSVFTRETLKEREAQQLSVLADRLQNDLAALSLQATQVVSPAGGQSATQALAIGSSLLDNLRRAEPVGRLVIDLKRVTAAKGPSHEDVVLKNGDRLLVPGVMQEVTVLGEVQSATSHLWDPKLTLDDYIGRSGGTTQSADAARIYIVRANGSVVSGNGNGNAWFGNDADGIRPGDTIVVPLDAQRMRPLPLWTAVTTIIYNLAVAVAAVNSF